MADEMDREYAELLRAGEPKPTIKRKRTKSPRYVPEEPEYYPGDVVLLRSGGPRMTIWNAVPAVCAGCWPWMYACYWFDTDGDLRKENFPGHVLKLSVLPNP